MVSALLCVLAAPVSLTTGFAFAGGDSNELTTAIGRHYNVSVVMSARSIEPFEAFAIEESHAPTEQERVAEELSWIAAQVDHRLEYDPEIGVALEARTLEEQILIQGGPGLTSLYPSDRTQLLYDPSTARFTGRSENGTFINPDFVGYVDTQDKLVPHWMFGRLPISFFLTKSTEEAAFFHLIAQVTYCELDLSGDVASYVVSPDRLRPAWANALEARLKTGIPLKSNYSASPERVPLSDLMRQKTLLLIEAIRQLSDESISAVFQQSPERWVIEQIAQKSTVGRAATEYIASLLEGENAYETQIASIRAKWDRNAPLEVWLTTQSLIPELFIVLTCYDPRHKIAL